MDPVSLAAMAIGGLASAGASSAMSSSSAAPQAPAAPPPVAAPQQTPNAKPKQQSATPSFLAGASMIPGATSSGGPQGKSLLGQ